MDGVSNNDPLSREEQSDLLKLSRKVLEEHTLEGRVSKDVEKCINITEKLTQNSGVFVTLKISGNLRGCIGVIQSQKPLYEGVIQNTISSCSRDPRFSSVTKSELEKIEIEISVLSPPVEIPDYTHFEVGKHGVIINKGGSAVFLPQVAPEQGWDREQTLCQLSRKAGLDKYAWKEKDARFEVFTAQFFHEEK